MYNHHVPGYLSHAKINLTLDVLDQRPDGYHNLESVVAGIELGDIISIEAQPGPIIVSCSLPDLPCDERNLACRAAEMLQREAGLKYGACIHLQKNIPLQAGLGGGSSNAATVLWALNALWDLHWPRERLRDMAARLGSDVPFFLYGGAALLEGRGERVTPLESPNRLALVLVKPDFGISTAWAYKRFQTCTDSARSRSAQAMIAALRSGDPAQVARALFNDFDGVVCEAHPEIAGIHRALRGLGAMGTLLCGSGSAVFGIFEDMPLAECAAQKLHSLYPFVCATRSLASPI